ncbi:unnamed protein product [Rotaria sp. Silwood1]|nr:unnamed protein product [Rotaria sp. Silwood1]
MTTSTITSQSPVTTIPTTTRGETSATPNDLGLILGLSLGLGIPALIILTGGIVYFVKKPKTKSKVLVENSTALTDIPMKSTDSATNRNATATV